jgi:DNA-binding MarR family transcriptional regulator
MKNVKTRKRAAASMQRALAGTHPLGRSSPLTTTLKSFVKDGSDREFRDLIYTMVALTYQMGRHRKLFAEHIGVSEAQAVMLRMIAESQEATVGQLAQQLHVTSQFVTIEIGALVKKGIVEKRPNEADRRSMLLHLTTKGQNMVRELSAIMRIANDIHFRSLTEDRAKMLQDTLNAILTDGEASYHEISAPNLRGRPV